MRYLRRLSRVGVHPNLPAALTTRIVNTNSIAFSFAVLFLMHTATDYFTDYHVDAPWSLFIALCFVSIPLLNRLGSFTAARLGLLAVFNISSLLYIAVWGKASGFQAFFLVGVALPFVMFSIEERWYVLVGTLVPVVLSTVTEFAPVFRYPSLGHGPLPSWYPYYALINARILLVIVIYRIYTSNARLEAELDQIKAPRKERKKAA